MIKIVDFKYSECPAKCIARYKDGTEKTEEEIQIAYAYGMACCTSCPVTIARWLREKEERKTNDNKI